MRRVSTRIQRGAALLALLALLTIPAAAYADTTTPAPTDPLQGRLGPPIGITADAEPGVFDDLWSWLMAHLGQLID
jgi:hypothetical protein